MMLFLCANPRRAWEEGLKDTGVTNWNNWNIANKAFGNEQWINHIWPTFFPCFRNGYFETNPFFLDHQGGKSYRNQFRIWKKCHFFNMTWYVFPSGHPCNGIAELWKLFFFLLLLAWEERSKRQKNVHKNLIRHFCLAAAATAIRVHVELLEESYNRRE